VADREEWQLEVVLKSSELRTADTPALMITLCSLARRCAACTSSVRLLFWDELYSVVCDVCSNQSKEESEMAVKHVRLGKHGALVSNLCLGTMNFGWVTRRRGKLSDHGAGA
jgi:hypothetical protein